MSAKNNVIKALATLSQYLAAVNSDKENVFNVWVGDSNCMQDILTVLEDCQKNETKWAYYEKFLDGVLAQILEALDVKGVDPFSGRVTESLEELHAKVLSLRANSNWDSKLTPIAARLSLMVYGAVPSNASVVLASRTFSKISTVFQSMNSSISVFSLETVEDAYALLGISFTDHEKAQLTNVENKALEKAALASNISLNMSITVTSLKSADFSIEGDFAGVKQNIKGVCSFDTLLDLEAQIGLLAQNWIAQNKAQLSAAVVEFEKQEKAKEEKVNSILSSLSVEELKVLRAKLGA